MAYLLSPYRMYEDDGYQGLLGEPMDAPLYADAGQQVQQVTPTDYVSPLALQFLNQWKQFGIDPNIQGVDRSRELADMLVRSGITDISSLKLNPVTYERQGGGVGFINDNEVYTEPYTYQDTGYQLSIGDKNYGTLAGFGSNGEYVYRSPEQYLATRGDNAYNLGTSYAGKGYVDYNVLNTPNGPVIVPQWGSSSDASDIRNALMAAFLPAAAGMGLQALGLGGTAGGTAAGTAAGTAGTSGSTLGSLGTVTQLGTPMAEAAAMGSSIPVANLTAGLPTLAAPSLLAPEVAAFRPSMNYGPGMTGAETSIYDSVVGATGSPTAANAATQTLGPLSQATQWMKDNPLAGRLLMSGATSLLSAAGGKSSGGGGYVDSGYRPTITRGGWSPSVQAKQMPTQSVGLLNRPTTGQPMSGLWRYGLLG